MNVDELDEMRRSIDAMFDRLRGHCSQPESGLPADLERDLIDALTAARDCLMPMAESVEAHAAYLMVLDALEGLEKRTRSSEP